MGVLDGVCIRTGNGGTGERVVAGQELMVKREFPTPWGVCDLVGCSLNELKVRKRLLLGQRKRCARNCGCMCCR